MKRFISLLFFLSIIPFTLILKFYNITKSQHVVSFTRDTKVRFLQFLVLFLLMHLVPVSSHSAIFNIPPEDVGALIDAIILSNSNGEGGTINLAVGSTYTLSPANDVRIPFSADGFNGLPSITSEISINGNGSNNGNLRLIATGEFMFEPCRLDDGSACNAPP